MESHTVILIGPSGCGKGTQAELLKSYLEENDETRPTHYFQTGSKFREFMEGETYTQRRIKEELTHGRLAPAFLPIWIWSSLFIEGVTGDEHLIIDGFPRRAEESPILHSALQFYERHNVKVVVFDIPDEAVVERLVHGRKRFDDTEEEVRRRLAWFRRDVRLTIEYFREHPDYDVRDIDAARSVEEVHRSIVACIDNG